MEALHLFQDEERQTYAARDLAHAKELWKADTGPDSDPEADTAWTALDDSTLITVTEEDDNGVRQTKTAAEWAREYGRPGYCFGGG